MDEQEGMPASMMLEVKGRDEEMLFAAFRSDVLHIRPSEAVQVWAHPFLTNPVLQRGAPKAQHSCAPMLWEFLRPPAALASKGKAGILAEEQI